MNIHLYAAEAADKAEAAGNSVYTPPFAPSRKDR